MCVLPASIYDLFVCMLCVYVMYVCMYGMYICYVGCSMYVMCMLRMRALYIMLVRCGMLRMNVLYVYSRAYVIYIMHARYVCIFYVCATTYVR